MDLLSQHRGGGSHYRGLASSWRPSSPRLRWRPLRAGDAESRYGLGDGRYGQLGDGTTTGSSLPVAVSELSGVTAVSAGGEHGLALLSNGTVMAWGDNDEGELGNGTTGGRCDVPVPVSGLSGVTAISAGTRYSLALLSNGTVMAWVTTKGASSETEALAVSATFP